MCEYSHVVPSRLAISGENLIAHRFAAGLIGLVSALDVEMRNKRRTTLSRKLFSPLTRLLRKPYAEHLPAVCVPPGARLLIQDIHPNMQREWGFLESAEEGVFTQITPSEGSFRDAIRFPNGLVVLLQKLSEGQRVRVLDFSSSEGRQTDPSGQRNERSIFAPVRT